MNDVESWRELGQQLRVDSIRACMKTTSGHPTSSMSAADLMAVLLAKYLHYDFDEPENPNNDHLVFSKGHASPLLYSMYKAAGAVSDEELLTFRTFGSRLQGHPANQLLPGVEASTGSLGQGLSIGVGMALAAKLDGRDSRVAAANPRDALDNPPVARVPDGVAAGAGHRRVMAVGREARVVHLVAAERERQCADDATGG